MFRLLLPLSTIYDFPIFSILLYLFLLYLLYKFLTLYLINRSYLLNIQALLFERQTRIRSFLDCYSNSVPSSLQTQILSLTACELLNKIKTREITSEQILITYSIRAATIGVDLGLTCDVNFEEAIAEAKEKDKELKNTSDISSLPLLYGLPISVKDHITAKGLRYTAGFAKRASKPKSSTDCTFIKILRDNGAIIYISSNIPQGIGSIETSNKIWGRALNPWDRSRTPGGSSGGEAGLISSKCSPLGIGSDAAGSIRIPCSFCGIYGFAPTGKRISLKRTLNLRIHDINVPREVNCIYGPMGQTVEDLVLVCKCVFGKFSVSDPDIAPYEWRQEKYQESYIKKKKRIGVIYDDEFCESFPANRNVITEVVEKLKEKGHEIILIKEKWTEEFLLRGLPVMLSHGMASNLVRTLEGESPESFYKLQVILSYFPNFVLKFFGFMSKYVGEGRLGRVLSVMIDRNIDEYYKCVYEKEMLKERFSDFWIEKNIDALISPILPFPAIKHGDAELLQGLIGNTFIYNIMGMPSGVVPIRNIRKDEQYYNTRFNDMVARKLKNVVEGIKGLPVGIQVAAWSYNDEFCLALMKEIEDEFKYHEFPKI